MKKATTSTTKLITRYNALFEEMNKKLVCREDEITALKYALLLRQNVLFFGKPGTAKSLMASMLMQAIKGATTFQAQLRKEMTGDAVFGPLNITKYQTEGVLEYNTAGMLPEAQLVYLDEFFDANDNLMRGLLECLNERLFTCGRTRRHIPLHTCIATTNFYKPDEKREAVTDRFLIRVKVDPISGVGNVVNMFDQYLGKGFHLENTLDYSDLELLCEEVYNITIPDITKEEVATMLQYHTEARRGVRSVSDRRLCWALDLLRANALLRNAKEVDIEDFPALQYAFGVVHDDSEERNYFAAFEKITYEHPYKVEGWKDIQQAFKVYDVSNHVLEHHERYTVDQITEMLNTMKEMILAITSRQRRTYDTTTENRLQDYATKIESKIHKVKEVLIQKGGALAVSNDRFNPAGDFESKVAKEVNITQ